MVQNMVAITMEQCTGCDLCIPHCPFEALLPLQVNPPGRGHPKRPVIVVENHCVGCLSCIGSCPTNALYEVAIPLQPEQSPLLSITDTKEFVQPNRWGKNGLGWA